VPVVGRTGGTFYCPGQYIGHEAIVSTGEALYVWHREKRYLLTEDQPGEHRAHPVLPLASAVRLRYAMAQNVDAAIEAGLLKPGGVYPTQKAYAAAIGTSEANVVALKRLGVAIRLGCRISDGEPTRTDPGIGKDWTLLSSKAGDARIGAMLRRTSEVTPEKLYARLHRLYPQGR
jgi:hypothetical protein